MVWWSTIWESQPLLFYSCFNHLLFLALCLHTNSTVENKLADDGNLTSLVTEPPVSRQTDVNHNDVSKNPDAVINPIAYLHNIKGGDLSDVQPEIQNLKH